MSIVPVQGHIAGSSEHLPEIVLWSLAKAAEDGGSDVHITGGQTPWMRRGGSFKPQEQGREVTEQEALAFFDWAGGTDHSSSRNINGVRWRVTSYLSEQGPQIACRRIPDTPPALAALGLPKEIQGLASLHHGLVLAAGPTGSGKTTTLAAIISLIVKTRAVHLLTIEDPVEYHFPTSVGRVTHRELGPGLDNATAFATAMRSDPDIILLGEIRSPADIGFCLDLASSGHLVFSTIHASDAGTVCERFSSAAGDSGRSALAQVLQAIIVQRLLPSAADEHVRFPAFELLLMDDTFRQIVRPGGTLSKIRQHLVNQHRSLDHSLLELVTSGTIDRLMAEQVAVDPHKLSGAPALV